MGAADDEAEEPAARHRGQAGVTGRRELVDDRRRVRGSLRELADEAVGDAVGVEAWRDRALGEGGEPLQGVLVGAVEAGAAVDHLVSVRPGAATH